MSFIDPFEMQKCLVLAWTDVCKKFVDKEQTEARQRFQQKRLDDTETELAFGYAVRWFEKDRGPLSQAKILDALVPPWSGESDDRDQDLVKSKRHAVRQSLTRRFGDLHAVGFIVRTQLQQNSVLIEVTETGWEARQYFTDRFNEYVNRNKIGDQSCIAAQ